LYQTVSFRLIGLTSGQ